MNTTKTKLRQRITVPPQGMRRTFNDLMRLAKVESIVTKSISGHQTDRMREHYSTVTPDEQRRSISNVVSLFGPRQSAASVRGHPGRGGDRARRLGT
ncbi:MAG: hypothetical protein ACLP1X_19395 [Polyangiaceae bacterium]